MFDPNVSLLRGADVETRALGHNRPARARAAARAAARAHAYAVRDVRDVLLNLDDLENVDQVQKRNVALDDHLHEKVLQLHELLHRLVHVVRKLLRDAVDLLGVVDGDDFSDFLRRQLLLNVGLEVVKVLVVAHAHVLEVGVDAERNGDR